MSLVCPPARLALRVSLLLTLSFFGPQTAQAQAPTGELRIATWNVTNFGTTSTTTDRYNSFKTALYGSFEGRQFAPDVLLGQEFLSQTAVNNFVTLLNTAQGSPGDWSAAPFIDGPDTDAECFFRTSKASLLRTVTVNPTAGVSPDQPRNTYRYDLSLTGLGGQVISAYSSHMKSGTATDDMNRRQVEAQRIRDNAATLGTGALFLYAGDMNIQSSSQQAYQTLVSGTGTAGTTGQFVDPIKTPGSWENNAAYKFVDTQDPATQMDSRFDQLLLSSGFLDGRGLEYDGDATKAYSTTTWNDPNHSYRVWGNDGTSFNGPLTTTGNTEVGPDIAQALITSAEGNGHLPVYLDLKLSPVPAPPGVVSLLIGGVVTLLGAVRRQRNNGQKRGCSSL